MTSLSRIWNAVRQVSPSAVALMIIAPLTAVLVAATLLHTPAPSDGPAKTASISVDRGSKSTSHPSLRPSADVRTPSQVVAFLGDSYAFGKGATSSAKRWATLVSIDQGWVENNLSQGGTSYSTAGDLGGKPYTARIGRVVASGAQIVVVSGGRRDLGVEATVFRADVRATLEGIQVGLPQAKIFVVSPIWDNAPAPAGMVGLTSIVEEEAHRVGATYLNIGDPLLGHPTMVVPEGAYPNDAGHAAIATAVEKALA